MRRLSSMGKQIWKRNSDRPCYDGEYALMFCQMSYFGPQDFLDDYFNTCFGEPEFNGEYFNDLNEFDVFYI